MNSNCLELVMCPQCGSTDMFHLTAQCVVTVTDDGTQNERSFEWDGDNDCTCAQCGHHDAFGEFSQPAFFVGLAPDGEQAHSAPGMPDYVFDPTLDHDPEVHPSMSAAVAQWAADLLKRHGATRRNAAHPRDITAWSTKPEPAGDHGALLVRTFRFAGFSDALRAEVNEELAA